MDTKLGNPDPAAFADTFVCLRAAQEGKDRAYDRLLERFREWQDDEVNVDDAKLGAAILDEARLQFERQFDFVDFYVLIYPRVQDETTDMVINHLRTISDEKVRVLDYRNLLNGEGGPPWFIKEDPHPAAPLHKKVAAKLAEDLGGG